jgi:hypothetical protein
MAITEPLPFMGAPESPYTRGMIAHPGYRHIRFRFLSGDQRLAGTDCEPLIIRKS